MDDTQSPSVTDTGSGQTTVPASGSTGETTADKTQSTLENLPSTLKGKSPDQIAEMYVSLEKKLGEQSGEVSEARKLKEQTETMLRAIWSDPDLYRQVEVGIQKYLSGEELPDTRKTDKAIPKQGDEEAVGQPTVSPEMTELRKAQENQILNKFFDKYGYNGLSEQEKKDSYARLAVGIAELVDPGGNKPLQQILNSIPLTKLDRYLENAHFIVNKDKLVEQGKRSALLSREENEAASIGSLSSSSVRQGPSVTLSERERTVAQKMGISEETYLKRKQEVMSDQNRFQ